MECGGKCIKWLLFLFNFIFFLMGIGLIAVGAYLNVEHDDWKDISDFNYMSVANVAIAAGVIIMIVCFCGCYGAVTENKIMVGIFFVCILVIFILELGAGIGAYVKRGDVEAELVKQLRARVPSRYYTETGIKVAVDAVQKWWDCCGINNASDYYTKPSGIQAPRGGGGAPQTGPKTAKPPTSKPKGTSAKAKGSTVKVPTVVPATIPSMPTDAEMVAIRTASDTDGNGKIDSTEFAPIVKKYMSTATQMQITGFYMALDTDKDGDISEAELKLIAPMLQGGMMAGGAGLSAHTRRRRNANNGYTLVAEKKECAGAEQCTDYNASSGWYASADDCAAHCKSTSNMFAYGTNEFGHSPARCKNGKCMCCCETASKDGVCTDGQADHTGYKLYKFNPVAATSKYTHHVKTCVSGHNIKTYPGKTVAECEAICDKDKTCKGFEYGVAHGGKGTSFNPRDCTPQSSADTAGCDGPFQNLDFYEKPGCKTVGNKPCIFPFKYYDVTYNACTTAKNIKMWCATAVTNGVMVVGSGGWDECDDVCFPGQDYWLVESKKECTKSGSGVNMQYKKTVQECADACRTNSTMFIYGTNDYGTTRCDATGCACWCQTGATPQGTCSRVDHLGYNLYRTVGRTVPVNCEWNDWVEDAPGKCSSECGAGVRKFTRTKKVVEANGGTCTGLAKKEDPCQNVCCKWNPWNRVGKCSSTCRNGTQNFSRTKKIVEKGEGTCKEGGKPAPATKKENCRNVCSPNFVPKSCCKETARKLGSCSNKGYWEESQDIKSQFHWTTGCYTKIRQFLLDNLLYVGITGVIFALIQILGMILAALLFCQIRKDAAN